ncbi:HEAT repeat domain-containing protein [Natrinema altunense]|uniref:HEAT repeat domain-containing protein n=2 Tax=Natrinema altunense TaxID=222984 RepID=UPI0013EE7E27|nr:HEAT repeat domain-containing protein [Natrinema altunense]
MGELVDAFEDGTAGDVEFEALRELLAAEDGRDRDVILYGIRSVGIVDEERTEAAVDVLLEHCFDQPRRVREPAAESLSDIGRERAETVIRPAVDTLQQCLGDADESTRSEAMLALRELCKHHAELFVPIADDLRGVLDDDNTWIRERALIVLGEIAAGRPEAIDPPFDDFEACLDDDVPNVRSKAILRLGSIAETYPDADRPSIDDFQACLDDDSWTVRSSATTALASLAETHPETVRPVIDDILELLSPSAEFVGSGPGGEQIHIMLALGRLGVTYPREAPRIVSALQRIFDEDGAGNTTFEPIYELTTGALETIAAAHPTAVVPAIEDLTASLDASRLERRRSAAKALAAVGRAHSDEVRPAVENLETRLEDEDPWVRMEATEALLAIDAVDPEAATAAEGICALLLADDESTEAIERFVAAKPAVRALVITELRSRVGDMDSVDEKPTVAAAFRTISTIDDAYLHLS